MPKEALFDPCRQWLGIDAVDLGKARLVLGIRAEESDPAVVVRAAEARLNLLRAIAPGPFELARTSLLKRVEEAREKVLAEIAAGPSRLARPAADGFVMPAPPSQVPTAPPSPAASGRSFSPPAPGPGLPPPVPAPLPGAAGGVGGAADGIGPIIIRKTVYRKKTPVAGISLALLGLTALACGLAYYKFSSKSDRKGLRQSGRQEMAQADHSSAAERDGGGAVQDRVGGGRMPAAVRREDRERDERVEEPPLRPQLGQVPEQPQQAATKPDPREAEREDQNNEDRQGSRPDSAEDQQQVGNVEETLAEVFAAMRAAKGRPDDAAIAKLLDAAAGQAGSGEAKQRVKNWRALARFHAGFFDYRDQAVAAVKAGDEYDYKDRRIAIVDIDEQFVKFRDLGQKKQLPRDDLPAGIMLAIVTSWFDKKPANDLFLGAYHFAKPEPNAQLARTCWEQAEARGADASALLPLLDDSVFIRAIGQDGRK